MDAARSKRLRRWACVVALCLGASYAYCTPSIDCFDDEKLGQIIAAKGRGTLIYVWSPRSVYSVQQMAVAARSAAVHGLDFLPLRDALEPRVEPRPLLNFPSGAEPAIPSVGAMTDKEVATPPYFPPAHNSQLLCAPVLLSSEATRHFPTAFVVTSQGVHRFPIVGAMPPAGWLQSIGQRLPQP
ncbi:MAG: hypothetical protein ACKO1L_13175 [Brachymonas sp.]